MCMARELGGGECHGFDTGDLAENVRLAAGSLAGTDDDAPTQVRQAECALTIATEGGPQQRKQRRVLRYLQQRSVTKCQPTGAKLKPTAIT